MVVEETPVQVIKVIWSELTEVFEFLLFDGLEDKLLVMGGKEAHRGLTTAAFKRVCLANRVDKVEVRSGIVPSHRLEALGILNRHLEVDFGDLKAIIDVAYSMVLFVRN